MANNHPIPNPSYTPRHLTSAAYEDRPLSRRRRYAESASTDILGWLRENAPQDYSELKTLRRALYTRETNGHWIIEPRGQTAFGEEKFVLIGRVGAVLFVSNKSRHFLLRNLNRLRKAQGWPPIVY
jgi:hypothetical protein